MSNASAQIVRIQMLPNGTEVPLDLYRELRRQVEDAIRWLPLEVPCDIGDLVTPAFWLPLGKWTRSKLGRCLAHWVATGELSLEFVGSARRPHKRYRLRR
jgi:hypothetical protein